MLENPVVHTVSLKCAVRCVSVGFCLASAIDHSLVSMRVRCANSRKRSTATHCVAVARVRAPIASRPDRTTFQLEFAAISGTRTHYSRGIPRTPPAVLLEGTRLLPFFLGSLFLSPGSPSHALTRGFSLMRKHRKSLESATQMYHAFHSRIRVTHISADAMLRAIASDR